MHTADTLRFATRAAAGNLLRTALMVLAMAIGVAAVVVLTALGDGARRYVVGEFGALGSNLIIVLPGRSETGGINPGSFVTATPRDLTVEDAEALLRSPWVARIAPLSVGSGEISTGGRLREVTVVGTSADFTVVRQLDVAAGSFLPREDLRRSTNVAVIGATIQRELFGVEPAVGRLVRIGDRRFRVIGVMAAAGQGLGMNTDEMVIVPVGAALAIFDTNTLFRILVEARDRGALEAAKADIAEIIRSRHAGEEDVTLLTQDAVLATFDRILATLTLAVAGIAAISLAVAGILVMNVMLVSVTQRTAEIGLLKALGAEPRTIRRVFLAEAALLSLAGGLAGLALGHGGAALLRLAWPVLPAWPPDWAVAAGLGTALVTGVLFGVLPARRAARLDPVQALGKK
ncbi:FtsX-like permease family protein [Pseudothauera nasutitermitis]|uniref:FtsX-like permease family protein n=1 Tax=Pseudothauera nasutitermitis TaxID=2565930 RepID=A0A4S4AM60_9RHOO|nr:ABC transporter permease [Pseudothauera nasutitermitis]THF60574.1 FtsX-like permease family protein [Pseudothauera nasutitermitis]